MGMETKPADEPKKDPRGGFGKTFKKHWPIFLATVSHTWTWPGCYFIINILVISQLLYPGLPFQGEKLGILYGVQLIVTAAARLCYGTLVDRYSRVKLITVHHILQGIVFALHALIPLGGGDYSYSIYMVLTACFAILNGGVSAGGEVPVTSSYIDDATDEGQRSQVFGLLNMLQEVVLIFGMFLAALVFTDFWRTYFVAVGGFIAATGIIVGAKVKEPKRGAKKQELWKVLQMDTITYKYQLTRETVKSTILSRTNLIVLFEGIFTQITAAVPAFLLFAFFESPPYNFSPFALSILFILFCIPGIITGTMIFTKLSDRLGRRNVKNRIYLIFLGIVLAYFLWFILVSLPLMPLTPEEGGNISVILSVPVYWGVCVLQFFAQMVWVFYTANQRPVIQKINLPEAQGFITGANIFLENLGRGIGMALSGYFLMLFNGDYVFTIAIMFLLGMIGASMWLFTPRTINKDLTQISKILGERATELTRQNSS